MTEPEDKRLLGSGTRWIDKFNVSVRSGPPIGGLFETRRRSALLVSSLGVRVAAQLGSRRRPN
jgi:hypothetical protein